MEDDGFPKAVPWLAELSAAERRALRGGATCKRFGAGATIFRPTTEPHGVYLLEDGRVRIYRLSSAGREATLGFVAPGEVFGELPLFGSHPRESFAAALEDSIVWRFPADRLRALLSVRPGIVVEVTRQIGERMKRVESRVESLIFRDVRARLATMILELAEDFGAPGRDGVQVELRLSQAELATLIGASRQSVNEVLSEFRDAGWVAQQDGRLVVVRPERLRTARDED